MGSRSPLAWLVAPLIVTLAVSAAEPARTPLTLILTTEDVATVARFYESALGWSPRVATEGPRAGVALCRGETELARVTPHPAARKGVRGSRIVPVLEGSAPAETEALALAKDPEGAVFAVANRERMAQVPLRPDAWPVLLSDRPEHAAEHYTRRLGWTLMPEARTPLFAGDFVWWQDGRPRAALAYQPPGRTAAAGWLVLFGVADLDARLQAAWRAGGKVLSKPGLDLIGGRVAVLSDPWGAVFGIYEWVSVPESQAPGRRERFSAEALEP